jgi:hypothetical protein
MAVLGAQDGLQPPRLRRGYRMGGPLQADQRTYMRIQGDETHTPRQGNSH